MKTSHTPGPWKQHETEGKIYASIRGPRNETIADCGSRSDQQAQANARLIAAAPELLASLMAIYEMVPFDVPESDPRVTMARELILKLTQP